MKTHTLTQGPIPASLIVLHKNLQLLATKLSDLDIRLLPLQNLAVLDEKAPPIEFTNYARSDFTGSIEAANNMITIMQQTLDRLDTTLEL